MKKILFITFTRIFSFLLCVPILAISIDNTIAVGDYDTFFIDENSNVWAIGTGKHGQLGLEDEASINEPVKLSKLPPIIAVTAGSFHSFLLDINGNVWAMGDNGDGQLGLGDEINRNKPVKLSNLPPITAMTASSWHSLFLDSDGNVWAMGSNSNGQLGLKGKNNANEPVPLFNLPTITAMTASSHYNLLLDIDGDVWGMGQKKHDPVINMPAKLCNLYTMTTPVQAGFSCIIALDVEGNVSINNDYDITNLNLKNYEVMMVIRIPNRTKSARNVAKVVESEVP